MLFRSKMESCQIEGKNLTRKRGKVFSKRMRKVRSGRAASEQTALCRYEAPSDIIDFRGRSRKIFSAWRRLEDVIEGKAGSVPFGLSLALHRGTAEDHEAVSG